MAATVQEAQQALINQPHVFLQPTTTLHTTFLQLAKRYLDPLASDVTEAQLQRQKLQRQDKKRKRGANDDDERIELLRMKKVHVDGFEVDQVWQQARRVLDAATDEVEREIPEEEDEDEDELESGPVKSVRFDDEGFEVDESDHEVLGEEGIDYEVEGEDVDEEDDMDGEDPEGIPSDEESLDIGDLTPESDAEEEEQPEETYIKDPNNLNDGFFSIDDFNKQSQFLEQQDFRGEDDGAASDEEDIDWGSNPFAMGVQTVNSTSKSKQKPSAPIDEEEEDDDDENDGPTFGNMALNAPEGDSDAEDLDMNDAESLNSDDMDAGDTGNANNIMYTDFFAPPARSASYKPKKNKMHESRRTPATPAAPKLATELHSNNDNDAEAAALHRAMSAVQRDLFNEASASEDDGMDEDIDPDEYDTLAATASQSDPRPARQNLSTHEKRQLALRSEIRRLEAVAVASKPWYLTGESLAASRPENALLEEDLEFERAGKPVPVITEEANEDIAALIKRRILARDFDEIPRRRPGEADLAPKAKRGKVEEVSTTRASKGLAEEYEDDLLRRTDPNYVDERSEALKAQHVEIEGLWKYVSSQLDALSNWHYKPRPAGASLEVRSDVASVALEDARPSLATGGDVGARVLAPQEVYKPGGEEEAREEDVVRTKGGQAVSREEMSREQKVRRRRREKERQRKAGANEAVEAVKSNVVGDVDGKSAKKEDANRRGKKGDRREVEAQLKKGGAKIIDSKGMIRDVEGNVAKESVSGRGGVGSLRL